MPRYLFFVNEIENPILVQAAQTMATSPRRGVYDRRPWRDLDLTALSGQPIENSHIFSMQLNETLVPYNTLEPLKVVLPLQRGRGMIPTDPLGPGGVQLGGMAMRMRTRWQTISHIWEANKSPNTRLNLLGQIDYMRKLSAQLQWQADPEDRPFRVLHSQGGQPTAAICADNDDIVDVGMYWVTCQSITEANYLLAIINSEALYVAVAPLMSRGQFGARNLHKQMWKLPIPAFDTANPLHVAISEAGETAAAGAAKQLAQLREQRDNVTVTIARREIRKWLRESDEGKAVEEMVDKLLAGG